MGNVVGPGTDAVSLSLIKSIKITEQLQFQFGAQAANALNHRNYDVPNQFWMIGRLERFPVCRPRKELGRGMWRSRAGSVSRGWLGLRVMAWEVA